jgi:3-deoxy-D-manno-octulosonic-acid transferase
MPLIGDFGGETTAPHVVFACENFGELLLIKGLTRQLTETEPSTRVTWMIRDLTSLDHVRENFPDQPVCYWPFDFIIPVARFLRMIKPDVLVLTERFRYTNLVCGSNYAGVKVVLINGRFKNLHWIIRTFFRPLYRWTFDSLSFALMQSENYATGLKAFTSTTSPVRVVGDLKEDRMVANGNCAKNSEIEGWLTSGHATPLLAAGSTDGLFEEGVVLEAFKVVRNTYPSRLLLAPRRLERLNEVKDLIERHNLRWSLRSEMDSTGDVLILDTLGELANAYQFAKAAYVGGALDGMGHNVMEPVAWSIPTSYGPRRGHFAHMQRWCEDAGIGFRISNAAELAHHWGTVLGDPDFQARASARLQATGEQRGGDPRSTAFQETLQLLTQLIAAGKGASSPSGSRRRHDPSARLRTSA